MSLQGPVSVVLPGPVSGAPARWPLRVRRCSARAGEVRSEPLACERSAAGRGLLSSGPRDAVLVPACWRCSGRRGLPVAAPSLSASFLCAAAGSVTSVDAHLAQARPRFTALLPKQIGPAAILLGLKHQRRVPGSNARPANHWPAFLHLGKLRLTGVAQIGGPRPALRRGGAGLRALGQMAASVAIVGRFTMGATAPSTLVARAPSRLAASVFVRHGPAAHPPYNLHNSRTPPEWQHRGIALFYAVLDLAAHS
ncbi:hypothetical protein PSPO01_03196 [Paraphaeosphaeria sporulosa]